MDLTQWRFSPFEYTVKNRPLYRVDISMSDCSNSWQLFGENWNITFLLIQCNIWTFHKQLPTIWTIGHRSIYSIQCSVFRVNLYSGNWKLPQSLLVISMDSTENPWNFHGFDKFLTDSGVIDPRKKFDRESSNEGVFKSTIREFWFYLRMPLTLIYNLWLSQEHQIFPDLPALKLVFKTSSDYFWMMIC